ncbi:CBR-NSF-1 protein [Loa loa]|uniref:Vesicle-fusing ATPase n=1 Tax=Loa loa TaxID=7209 RepID=A0A1S0UGR6_LOALO|nr:CBR-NSF-1 protein [Loa loa]EJD74014.1 CBR-NSF-1 protein [Loa loa]
MMMKMRVRKCPTDDLALTNCAILNANALNGMEIKHILVKTGPAHHFIFSVRKHPSLKNDEIAFALPQRKWAKLSLDQEVEVQHFSFNNNQFIGSITFAADFQSKKNQTSEPLNTDFMAREFSIQFSGHAFTRGELLVFKFDDDKGKSHTLALTVTSILGIDLSLATNPQAVANLKPIEIDAGQLLPNSVIVFDKAEESLLNLVGKSKGKSAYRSIINPDWDFQKMGIGGLDKEFSGIFRRAFASRVFPPEFIEQLGMKHVRGILLYGPPGTGKTLMARQIGKMLNAREPKIINGPQILDKYVGESESNIRKLFADAEEEWKRCGASSGLHIIIFDEIDAICKQRGSVAGSTAVHDTVVNQLLAKMDGVDQLNNILVIGMTNRKDMIDEALLRPGRMEVQMEISLPDEAGRLQILKIHTARMREYDKLDPNVDLIELAKKTKNFSGAELEGLVRAAQSSAMNRLVKAGGKVQLDADAVEKLMINVDDFNYALENDVKPAFGHSNEELEKYLTGGFISWSAQVTQILEQGALLVKQVRSPDTKGFASVLLAGSPNSGKTCLAAMIAKASDYPFIKVISAEDMVGYTETAKCAALRKVFDDAYRSPLSCVIVDGVERLLDFSPIGPRYSNLVLQALFLLVKKLPPPNRRLLVVATSSNRSFLRELGLLSAFCTIIDVPALTTVQHIMAVIEDTNALSRQECEEIRSELSRVNKEYFIGIKKLLNVVDMARECEPVDRVSVVVQSLMSETFGNS